GLPPVQGVRDQLVQVFLNLILNAIDATNVGGHILVRAETGDGEIVVHVQDDGAGIAPEHRERLFQPYFTTKKHGTGLGLFVTRKLVQDHGGDVQVMFGPDGGTTFQVRLPCMPSSRAVSLRTPRVPAGCAESPRDVEWDSSDV